MVQSKTIIIIITGQVWIRALARAVHVGFRPAMLTLFCQRNSKLNLVRSENLRTMLLSTKVAAASLSLSSHLLVCTSIWTQTRVDTTKPQVTMPCSKISSRTWSQPRTPSFHPRSTPLVISTIATGSQLDVSQVEHHTLQLTSLWQPKTRCLVSRVVVVHRVRLVTHHHEQDRSMKSWCSQGLSRRVVVATWIVTVTRSCSRRSKS